MAGVATPPRTHTSTLMLQLLPHHSKTPGVAQPQPAVSRPLSIFITALVDLLLFQSPVLLQVLGNLRELWGFLL